MTCTLFESKLPADLKAFMDGERKNNQCIHDGYFTVPTGYRLIPGDRCTPAGGANLGPKYYHCSGWENHHIFGYCGLFAILCAGYYYGQDSLPGSVNETVKSFADYFAAFGDCFKNLFQGVSEKAGAPPAELADQGYSNFEQAPAGLDED